MKYFMLSLLLLAGCSTWKQKDFEKEIDRPTDEASLKVEAPLDKKILDKFEIKPVEEKPKSADAKKVVTKKIEKNAALKVVEDTKPTVTKKSLPAGYPEDLVAINARAQKVWSLYKPNHNVDQKIFLNIHYLGMTVGKIVVTNKGKKLMNNQEVWHFHSRFKSAPFYSNIYELDDTVDTYVTTDQFLSSRYSLIQRESRQDVDDLQLFDRDQLKTFWFYKQTKKDNKKVKNKKLEKFIPYYSIDPFSIVFFYQGLPLNSGDVYEIPIVNKGKILILKSTVEGKEVVDTEYGNKKAIRVHAVTQYTGETLKSGDLFFWFSDDSERKLLKAQAKIKIGSVTADIVKD